MAESFLSRLSAVGRSDGHQQNVTLNNSRKLTAAEKRKVKRQTRTVYSPRAVQGGQLGTRQGFLHFGMLRVVEAIKRERSGCRVPNNEIEGAVPTSSTQVGGTQPMPSWVSCLKKAPHCRGQFS